MKKLFIIIFGIVFMVSCGKDSSDAKDKKDNTNVEVEAKDTSKDSSTSKEKNTSTSEFKIDKNAGSEFPEFELKSIDGKTTYKSSDIIDKNKKTLFVIAAEWCPHCQNESVEIQKFYEKHKDEANIIVVFSSNNSSPEIVRDYLARDKYDFPAYYDYDDVFLKAADLEFFPFNLIVGKDGKVQELVSGEVTYDKLVEKLTK